jgi:tripartite-type tricarboxylate transporter receptor subunit TctC
MSSPTKGSKVSLHHFSRWLRFIISGLAFTVLGAVQAQPATWPDKPIRLLVPYGPGSPPDLIARLLAQHLGVAVGKPVVVENKVGAIGLVAMRELMRQPADGYLLMNLGMTGATAPALLPEQKIDLRKEIEPVVQTDWSASVLVVNNEVPARTVNELVALMRRQPGELNFASGGMGTPAHLVAEVLKREEGLDAVHVPFPQFSQAVTELLANRVQMMFLTSSVAVPFVKDGKLRALAVVSPERLEALPSTPTMAEAGFAQFQRRTWGGFVARAGTPHDVVVRINREVNRILQMKEVRDAITTRGNAPAGGTPQEFRRLIDSETRYWGEVIRSANVKAQ